MPFGCKECYDGMMEFHKSKGDKDVYKCDSCGHTEVENSVKGGDFDIPGV